MKRKFITFSDILIIFFLLAISVLIYASFVFSFWGDNPEGVEICVDGKEYATYNFAEISGKKTVEIKSDLGSNVLEITNKDARMIFSTCSDKVDIQSGAVSKPGQVLVCVPNKVTVRVLGENKRNVDKVTY